MDKNTATQQGTGAPVESETACSIQPKTLSYDTPNGELLEIYGQLYRHDREGSTRAVHESFAAVRGELLRRLSAE